MKIFDYEIKNIPWQYWLWGIFPILLSEKYGLATLFFCCNRFCLGLSTAKKFVSEVKLIIIVIIALSVKVTFLYILYHRSMEKQYDHFLIGSRLYMEATQLIEFIQILEYLFHLFVSQDLKIQGWVMY